MTTRFVSVDSVAAALPLLSAAGARVIGGGTDLLVAMESGLDPASVVVDVSRVPGYGDVAANRDGSVRIGGGVRLEDVAAHSELGERFPALAAAARAVGTPALRAMGTVAGNLGQRPRCWYLRSRVPCLKNGGAGCPAVDGENQYHAILGEGPCRAAHPSDLAVALFALDAVVVARGESGERRLTIPDLYAKAASDPAREADLAPGEFVEAIVVPRDAAGGAQRFTKLMQRGAWDFATVSLAGARRTDGSVRIVLGGVAAGPWRVPESVEEDVASGALDDESADALAARALYDAEPLSRNGYKVQQAASLLRDAMRELSRA